MQRNKARVEAGLQAKGFQESSGDHSYFSFYTQGGKKTAVFTKTSLTPKTKVLSDPLLGAMARQCHISKAEFLQLVDCPLSRTAYEALLITKGKVRSG